jgi:GntR family transcriptional repressor for pyruvate dehydrogenase complex
MDESLKQFKKIKVESVVENIVQNIKALLAAEKLIPGDKLPSERVLSEYLGISRNSLREALKKLEALGVVEIKHGSGVYLLEPSYFTLSIPRGEILKGDRGILEDLIETRKIVDVEVAALAAQRATPEKLVKVEEYLEKCRRNEETVTEDGASKTQFERLLGEITGNRILMSLQEVTHTLWKSKQKEIGLMSMPSEIQYAQHYMIYKAVKVKDVAAAKESMVYHIEAPLRFIQQQNELPT